MLLMDETAIKLFRSILDSQVFAHPIALKIWIWCLCKATYKKRFLPLKIGKGYITIELLPGQFVFGRFKAEDELGIDGSTIYKWIQRFASDEYSMINIDSNNQYSIITICKWEEYQVEKLRKITTKEQPKNNSVTTEEQQRNTNNNVYKVNNTNTWRNDFNIYLAECKEGYRLFMEDQELLKKQQRLNPGINVKLSIEKGYANFWSQEAGWKHKKKSRSKEIDWNSTIINSIGINKVYYTKAELAVL